MVIVHDIGLAAYLKTVKKLPYANSPSKDENGRFIFNFDIEESLFGELRLEYLNSQFRAFDLEVKSLKKALNNT